MLKSNLNSIYTDETIVFLSDVKYFLGVDCFWIMDRKPTFDREKHVLTLRERIERGEEISKTLLGI